MNTRLKSYRLSAILIFSIFTNFASAQCDGIFVTEYVKDSLVEIDFFPEDVYSHLLKDKFSVGFKYINKTHYLVLSAQTYTEFSFFTFLFENDNELQLRKQPLLKLNAFNPYDHSERRTHYYYEFDPINLEDFIVGLSKIHYRNKKGELREYEIKEIKSTRLTNKIKCYKKFILQPESAKRKLSFTKRLAKHFRKSYTKKEYLTKTPISSECNSLRGSYYDKTKCFVSDFSKYIHEFLTSHDVDFETKRRLEINCKFDKKLGFKTIKILTKAKLPKGFSDKLKNHINQHPFDIQPAKNDPKLKYYKPFLKFVFYKKPKEDFTYNIGRTYDIKLNLNQKK